jgi:hypothetical protein
MVNIHTPTDNVLVKVAQHGQTAAANGTSVDTLGYTRALVITTITTAATSGVTATVQDSPDNSTFTAITNANVAVGASVTAQDNCFNVNLDKHNRYLRVATSSVSGTVGVDALVILFNGRWAAPTQDQTPVSV